MLAIVFFTTTICLAVVLAWSWSFLGCGVWSRPGRDPAERSVRLCALQRAVPQGPPFGTAAPSFERQQLFCYKRLFRFEVTRACLQRVADWGSPAHVGEMRRLDVTDAQWRRLEPLLPPEKPRTGRPNHDHRRVVSGMLWIHRTGAPWRDLPERYGPVGTVSSRFYRWCRAGVWDRILCALQAEADARGAIDWDLHFVDATIVRAHQHAAGARRTGAVGG